MLKAKSNILYNGKSYKAGDVFEADVVATRQLLKAGSAETVSDATEVTPVAPKAPAKPQVSEKPSENWTKVKLIGYARSLGLTVDQTATKKEVLKLIENAPVAPPVADVEPAPVTVNANAPVTEAPETPETGENE